MIVVIFAELSVVVGVRRSCSSLFGVSRAGHYRQLQPRFGPRRPRRRPVNALTDHETANVLAILRSAEFCELSPAQVWARLLDSGVFLCSIATMYRILRAVGETGERRRQGTHPAKKKPVLLATRPSQVSSWDIEKLRTNVRGEYYELYVIIDIYSRYVVGWILAAAESGSLAKAFITDTCKRHGIKRGQLALHADRGASTTSKPVTRLLRSWCRSQPQPPTRLERQPLFRSGIQNVEVLPGGPRHVRVATRRPRFLPMILRLLQR